MADPKLLSCDHQTKFKILDTVSMKKPKQDKVKKIQQGPVLES